MCRGVSQILQSFNLGFAFDFCHRSVFFRAIRTKPGVPADIIIFVMLGFAAGFLIAYSMGAASMADLCTDVAFKFIDKANLSVELNGDLIRAGLAKYGVR